MSKQPESFYNINKLHLIFAVLAVLLLVILVWVFVQDSDKSWKIYQRAYLTYDIERTRVKYDAAFNALMTNDEYKFLVDELKKAQADFKAGCAMEDLTRTIEKLQTQRKLADQESKFAKAHFDAAVYSYEKADNAQSSDAKRKWQDLENFRKQKDDWKRKTEDFDSQIKANEARIEVCSQNVRELERKERLIEKQTGLLERKLKKIDPDKMSFINRIANMVRDLPVLDLSSPKYKIEQIVLTDITDDMKLKQVPKVERCTTCHKGITNPDFKNAPQPLTTHPNLEMFLANDSVHPIEDFGCTVCHGGRGRGTSFNSSVHTPSSEEQAKEWHKKYDWQEFHHWEEPMLPASYTQASCFKCHSGQEWIPGAEKLNLGLHVIEKAGCYNCHNIEKYQSWPKSGPDLTKLASKISKNWAYKWILDPKSFRPDTWMPSYFNQANTSDPASKARASQEIHAMVAYLFAGSASFDMTAAPVEGDVQSGQKLAASVGCMACHQIKPQPGNEALSHDRLNKEHGPNLIGFGSKTSRTWLYNWLKDPKRYHPETRMPNLRLTDQEAADIAAYLSTGENKSFDKDSVPPVDDRALNVIVFDFLSQSETEKESSQTIALMSREDKLVYAGGKLIGQYGCYGCHTIKGFENAKPIGPELTKIGSADLHKLDFGFVAIEHSKHVWLKTKVTQPRIFDKDKAKPPLEKSKMPNFDLSEEEAEAVTTALLGFVNDTSVKNKKMKRTPEQLSREKGQTIVREFNCQACHKIEGTGATVMQSVKDYLVKYEDKSEADADTAASTFSPPNLLGVGQKLRPQWMFEFIHDPSRYHVRPWLAIRMPTYGFDAAQSNALVKYFNALERQENLFKEHADVSLNPTELDAAKRLFSPDYFNCTQCHVVGHKMPSGSGDNLSPDLSLARERLQPDWVIRWIKNPSAIMPGTKMPTFYDPNTFDSAGPEDILDGDENEQIRVLRNFLMNITEYAPELQTQAAAPAQTQPAPASSEETDFWGQ